MKTIDIPEGFIKFISIDYPNQNELKKSKYIQAKGLVSIKIKQECNLTVVYTSDDEEGQYFFEKDGKIQVESISEENYKNLYKHYKDEIINKIICLNKDESIRVMQIVYDIIKDLKLMINNQQINKPDYNNQDRI